MPQVTALGSIEIGEELFMDYGEECMFEKVKNTHLFDESKVKTDESEYNAGQKQRCNDVRHLLKLKEKLRIVPARRRGRATC